MIVDCYFCGLPVDFDPTGRLAELGITIEVCEAHCLAVVCNLCLDMAQVEGVEIEEMNQDGLKDYLEKDAA